MNLLNYNYIMAERVRAKMSYDEFIADKPSVIEIQTYLEMARSDFRQHQDPYSEEIIKLISGE